MHWRLLAHLINIIDRFTIANILDFDGYRIFHRALRFPLIRVNFKAEVGYFPKIYRPTSFNEKVAHRILFDHNPIFPVIVDKIRVLEYVKVKIGDDYLIPTLQIVDSPDEIDFQSLPRSFIIKMNHGSGRNIILTDKESINVNEVKKTLRKWFKEKYRIQQLIWFVQPKAIPRRILIEKMIMDKKGNMPQDYKFYVFNGKVEMVMVIQNRFTNKTQNFFDRGWNPLNVSRGFPKAGHIEKPQILDKMIIVAEKLAEDFKFMRVDLYENQGKIYFGELTPCPAGGRGKFYPQEYDYYLGSLWNANAAK